MQNAREYASCLSLFLLGAASGVSSGAILHFSSLSNEGFVPGLYVLPGILFGVGMAAIYCIQEYQRRSIRRIVEIIFVSAICYFGAFCFTWFEIISIGLLTRAMALFGGAEGDLFQSVSDSIAVSIPIAAGIAGALSTFAFSSWLRSALALRYTRNRSLWTSVVGGALACALSYPALSSDGALIFFLGWQSIMMVAIGLPMLRPTEIHQSAAMTSNATK